MNDLPDLPALDDVEVVHWSLAATPLLGLAILALSLAGAVHLDPWIAGSRGLPMALVGTPGTHWPDDVSSRLSGT